MTEKLTGAANRFLALVGAVMAVGVPLITLVVYFAQIGPSFTEISGRIADMKTQNVEQHARVEREQQDQNARIERIEESRRDGLQRLAKVEEAVTATKESLNQINAKLDRVLFGSARVGSP